MKYSIILFIFTLYLFVSCDTRINKDLLKISQLIEVFPDSAMTMLYQTDTLKLTPKEKADRRILLSQAYNLCGYSISSDSLIKPALNYYKKHGSDLRKAQAWYYYANVLNNANNIDEAVKGYLQAVQYAQMSNESKEANKYLVAIYHILGGLYSSQKYNEKAINYFDKAITLAQEINNEERYANAIFMKSMILYSSKEYEKAITTLETVKPYFAKEEMKEWIDLIILHYTVSGELENNGKILEYRNTIDRSKIAQLIGKKVTHQWSDSPLFMYDAVSAIVFMQNNKLDSASYYVEKAISGMSTPRLDNVSMYAIASNIYESKGDTSTALKHLTYYSEAIDSIYQAEKGLQVLNIEQKYRQKYDSDLIIAKHRHRTEILILIAVILCGIILYSIILYRRKIHQRDAMINDYLALIESYKETHDSLLSKLKTTDERESAIKDFLSGRFALIKDIASTYYTYGESKFIVDKMKQLALSPSMLNDIIQMSDFYNEYAVTRLKEQLPEWTARNYEFSALVIARFSTQEISVMLDMTLNGVYTLKSKLKRRIMESDAPDKELFIQYFS